jgi:hypothetical protein
MKEGPELFIKFLLNVLANVIAIALYAGISYLIWKVIW